MPDNGVAADDRWLAGELEALAPTVDLDAAQADLEEQLELDSDFGNRPRSTIWFLASAACLAVLVGVGAVLLGSQNGSLSIEAAPETDSAPPGQDELSEESSEDPDEMPVSDGDTALFAAVIGEDQLLVLDLLNRGGSIEGKIHDVSSGTSMEIASSNQTWRAQPAVTWTGREVLIVGGSNGPGLENVAIAYQPEADRWRVLPEPPVVDLPASAGSVWNGEELILWRHALALEPDSGTWRQLLDYPGRSDAGSTAVYADGEILVYGGHSGNDESGDHLNEGHAYEIATDSWRPLSSSPLMAGLDPASVWAGDRMLVYSGRVDDATSETVFATYEPKSDQWQLLTQPEQPLQGPISMTWDEQAKVVLMAESRSSNEDSPSAAHRFDLSTAQWSDLPLALPGSSGEDYWFDPNDNLIVVTGRADEPPILLLKTTR